MLAEAVLSFPDYLAYLPQIIFHFLPLDWYCPFSGLNHKDPPIFNHLTYKNRKFTWFHLTRLDGFTHLRTWQTIRHVEKLFKPMQTFS